MENYYTNFHLWPLLLTSRGLFASFVELHGSEWGVGWGQLEFSFKYLVHWFQRAVQLDSWNGKPMELFAVQVWSIWNQRNKLRLNQSCCLTKDLQKMALESWNEIHRSNLRLNRLSSSPTHHNVWTAPAPDSRGGARNFCLGGPICVANLLVYTNFYIHTQTHVSIHTQN